MTMRRSRFVLVVASALGVAAACASFGSGSDTPAGPDGGDGDDSGPGDASDAGLDGPTSCTSHEIAAEDASCGDLTQSGVNCGFCGHACLGSACVNSQCLPSRLYPDASPTGLLTQGIVGGEIVWSTHDGVVMASLLDGGASRVVTSSVGTSDIYGLFVNGDALYALSRNGTIYQASFDDGGLQAVIASDSPEKLNSLTEDATYLYWYNATEQAIDSWAKDSGASPPKRVQGVGNIVGLTAGETDLFWIEESSSGDGGTKRALKRRTSDGNVTFRAPDIGLAVGPGLDETYVYWGVDGAMVRATRTGSEPPETIATWTGGKIHLLAFALTANDVYWVAGGDSNAPSRDQNPALYTAPKCGGIVRRLEDAVELNGGILADSQYLYWASVYDVRRVAR
jgi:hypothetical protein